MARLFGYCFIGFLTKQPGLVSCFHGSLVETVSGMQEPGRGPFLSVAGLQLRRVLGEGRMGPDRKARELYFLGAGSQNEFFSYTK